MTLRSKIAMVVAEFLGTAALATVAINITRSQIGIGYFIAIGVGLAYGVLVLLFGNISGGHFNPAVTIGAWTIRKIATLTALAYLAAQMLGGLAAWQLNQYFTGQKLQNIAGKSFELKVLIAEAVGTLILTWGIAAALYRKDERSGKYAALFGGALFVGIVAATAASNGVLNPAVALGNQSWGRAYIFGPIIGAVVGMNSYALLFGQTRFGLNRGDNDTTVSRVSTSSATVEPTVAEAAPVTVKRSTRKTAAKKSTRSTAKRTTTRRRR
jgi:glycerol uptake facilitator-like aquaporin